MMGQRKARRLKAWKTRVVQKFKVTAAHPSDRPIFGLSIGDVFSISGVFKRHRLQWWK